MPRNFQLKAMNSVHRFLRAATGQRVGWSAMGMPVLELTTVGRKSGRPHTVMLTSPIKTGGKTEGDLVIVASRGGDDHHPAWFVNLRTNPDVEVGLRHRKAHPMRARVATPDERAELWPQIIADHQNYAGYQARTTREIPLVVLASPDS